MNSSEYIKEAEKDLLHVYNRFPVVFTRGEGVYLQDMDGKTYLDFAAGIGVMAFGYGDEEFTSAVTSQIHRLIHTSNLFYPAPIAEAADAVRSASGIEDGKVFFTNSGAEAIEGAIKAAKKFGYLRDGHNGHEVIAMEESFHGRTVGALSVTGTPHYREPFYPLMDGVKFARYNDIESVRSQITENTIAVLLEPVQGEGGVKPADADFLQGLRSLCDEKGILLIFDEIQCGLGRCGSMFVWQEYKVQPDILTSAKALGGGIPVGAFIVTPEVSSASLVPGDHGTTYGGNPLAMSAVEASLSIIKRRDLPAHVRKLSPYFENILNGFVEKYSFITEVRGKGFMRGLVLDESVKAGDVVSEALNAGIITLTAGGNVLRLLPPLVMEESGFDEMQRILGGVFEKYPK